MPRFSFFFFSLLLYVIRLLLMSSSNHILTDVHYTEVMHTSSISEDILWSMHCCLSTEHVPSHLDLYFAECHFPVNLIQNS